MANRTRSDLELKPAFLDVNIQTDLTTPILIIGIFWFLYAASRNRK